MQAWVTYIGLYFYSVIFKCLFSICICMIAATNILKYIPIVLKIHIKYLQLVITSVFNIFSCIVIVTIRYMYLTLRQSYIFWFIGNEAMHTCLNWFCHIICGWKLSTLVVILSFLLCVHWNSLWGCETKTSLRILQSQVFLHCWLL